MNERKETMMYSDICVRLVDNKTEKMIRAYHTTNLSETLKMYEFMIDKENLMIDIPYQDREDNYEDGYGGLEGRVRDVRVNFGDEINLLSINVYIDVY